MQSPIISKLSGIALVENMFRREQQRLLRNRAGTRRPRHLLRTTIWKVPETFEEGLSGLLVVVLIKGQSRTFVVRFASDFVRQ
jgi:hypothetical protein